MIDFKKKIIQFSILENIKFPAQLNNAENVCDFEKLSECSIEETIFSVISGATRDDGIDSKLLKLTCLCLLLRYRHVLTIT